MSILIRTREKNTQASIVLTDDHFIEMSHRKVIITHYYFRIKQNEKNPENNPLKTAKRDQINQK